MKNTIGLSIALALLCAVATTGMAQQREQALRHGSFAVKPHPNPPDTAQILRDAAAGTGLPMWGYSVTSSRDGNSYSGVMVGASPYTSNTTTSVKVQIVPIIFKIGPIVFDPTKPDNTCAGGRVPLTLFKQSPLFNPADFVLNGVDVGTGQYVDDFQRANFWDPIQANGGNYHTTLNPVEVLKPIEVVPGGHGSFIARGCEILGGVEVNWWDNYLTGTLLPELAKSGVGPSTFPIFLMYNVAMYIGNPYNCCYDGYHGSYGSPVQTYSPMEYDTSGLQFPDTYVAAHEIGEWMNDPLITNPVPAWGHVGQQAGCQNNLEVGDPLFSTNPLSKTMPNGYTYHMQELAYFSWFYGAPSIGAGGLFSDNGTFTTDAGSVCQ